MGHAFWVSAHLIVFGALVAAFLLWHWWPLALALAGSIGWLVWLATVAPMTALSPGEALRAKRAGHITLLVAAATGLALYLLHRYGA